MVASGQFDDDRQFPAGTLPQNMNETGQWHDWIAKNDISDEDAKQRAFELASRGTEKDYRAVGQWLNRSPASSEKTAVVSAFAGETIAYR